MAEHGGYRVPSHPAPVSGPGSLSKRTDGIANQVSIPDAGYGEQADFQEIQGGAQMGRTSPTPAQGAPESLLPGLQPMAADGDPNIPITSGADVGEGPGSDVLASMGLTIPQNDQQERWQDARGMHPGMVRAIVRAAERPDATPGLKRYARALQNARIASRKG